MKKVLTFGTFDHLHPGHIHYLSSAANLGDELYVVIARKETVKKIKGFYPDDSESTRLKNVASLPFVTKAILGNPDNPYKVIEEYSPDLICIGYDQTSFIEGLKNFKIPITKISSHQPEKYKSSILKKQKQNLPQSD